ncbi:hypothetical protein JCM10212_002543 [Sporobolomyces blumeae]
MVHDPSKLHAIPIPARPPPTVRARLQLVTFNVTFLAYLVCAHTFQLLFLPFLVVTTLYSFLTSRVARTVSWTTGEVYRLGINLTKEIFASVLVLISTRFGRSTFVVSCDSEEQLERLVERDERGKVVGFKLAKHAVWMSNHQCYVDWIIIWLVMAFGRVSEGIVIIIKASLQWAPLVGPAMQLFRFVFLSRSRPLSTSTMYDTARDAVERDDPFQLVIFPEGTLYSRLTRPKSKAFAEAQGIPDMDNILLPRSTGLLYTLRLLSTLFSQDASVSVDSDAPSSPLSKKNSSQSLTVYDLTIGYAGVPPQGYAQSYYTLQTIFGFGVAPPTVHVHVETLELDEIPIGDVRRTARRKHIEREIDERDRTEFENWLRARWTAKDKRMGRFNPDGTGFEDDVVVVGGDKGDKVARFEVRMRFGDWVRLTTVPLGLVLFARVCWVVLVQWTR